MVLLTLAFIISFTMVVVMLPRIMILSLRKRLFDPIDSRKVHSVPASRLGGVAFFPSILFSVWFTISATNVLVQFIGPYVYFDETLILESLSLLLLFLVGVYDDIIAVSYRKKFLVQIIAALLVIGSGAYFTTLHGLFGIETIPSYVGIPLTLFFYVFVINAINLIDGIDGLASLLSIMALFVYGLLLYQNELLVDSIISIATLGALVPFCYSNVFGIKRGATSKIFMGDTGALVVGAILGFSAVNLWNVTIDVQNRPINHIYFILAYTMLLIPCLDVARIVFHRYRMRKPIFQPDKNHIHHKFMALGLTARQALFCIIGLNVFFIALNIFLSNKLNVTYIILLDIVIWSAMHVVISKKIRD